MSGVSKAAGIGLGLIKPEHRPDGNSYLDSKIANWVSANIACGKGGRPNS